MKKVLVVWFKFTLNGGLGRFLHCARILETKGIALTFMSLSNDLDTPWPDLKGRIITYDESLKSKWDAIMVPGAGARSEQISSFKKLCRPSFGVRIQHVLNDPSRYEKFLEVNSMLKPQTVIFNNSHWNSVGDLKADRFYTISGAVDTRVHHAEGKIASMSEKIRVGGYGRKNPEPLIRTILMLPQNYELNLYGLNTLDTDSAKELVNQDRLKFWGSLYDDELAGFYRHMDIVVTTEVSAGWCNTAAQAMMHGLPVISTIAGTIDFAEDKKNILLLRKPSADEIKDKIEYLVDNPEVAKELSANASEKLSRYSWEAYCDELMEKVFKTL